MTVVFDLDGTLVDSVGDLAASVAEVVTRLGGRVLSQEEVGLMVGDGAGLLVRRALSAGGLDADTPGALEDFLDIYDRRLLDTTIPYTGIEDALAMASRRGSLAVLTNKPQHASERILDALGLRHYFTTVVGGDGPHGRKPDPAGLRAIAGGDAVLLVGDSPVDWQTTVAAGCAFAWARYGFGAARFDEAVPDTPYVLEQPADLAAVLDRFAAVTTGA
jgi:phosphoglycolate phosphatase